MARKISVEIVGDSRSVERAFKRAGGAADSFGSRVGRASKSVAKGIGVAGVALAGLAVTIGVKSVMATSNLGEQINKVGVVFGKAAGPIKAWAKTTASSIGISNRMALEAAGVFGNMLVPMGVARKDAARMSKRMVVLAADMASFNNASPEEVLDALRAGLAGETEPLRRFGVFLNDARLKEKALEMGLYDGTGALDAIAKAQATYALILQDTNDAQGDFKRTSTSVPNLIRSIKAVVEDLSAAFGQGLLPVVQKVALQLKDRLADPAFKERIRELGRVVGEKLLAAVKAIGKWFEENWEGIKSAFRTGAELARSVARAVSKIYEWFQKVATVTPGGAGTLMGVIISGMLLSKVGLLNKLLLTTLRRTRLIGSASVGGMAAGGGGRGGGRGGKGGGKAPFMPLGVPLAVAGAVVSAAGGGTQRGDRSGQYPLTFAAWRKAARGKLGPRKLKILRDALRGYSLANAPDEAMRNAEQRLRGMRNAGLPAHLRPGTHGGDRARGGGVMPGVSYLVGESGPERFTPGGPGNVSPMGGGMTIGNVNLYGVQNPQQMLRELQRIANTGAAPRRGRYGGANLGTG